jgi:C-terminal processing protease CtpA/Prc
MPADVKNRTRKLTQRPANEPELTDLDGNSGQASRFGVIDLPSFYCGSDNPKHPGHKSASADVAKWVEKLKQENVRGIILDLRRKSG